MGLGFALLLAPGTHAGVQHLYLGGDFSARKIIAKNDLQVPCDSNCEQKVTLSEVSPFQTSATVNCPECTLIGRGNDVGRN